MEILFQFLGNFWWKNANLWEFYFNEVAIPQEVIRFRPVLVLEEERYLHHRLSVHRQLAVILQQAHSTDRIRALPVLVRYNECVPKYALCNTSYQTGSMHLQFWFQWGPSRPCNWRKPRPYWQQQKIVSLIPGLSTPALSICHGSCTTRSGRDQCTTMDLVHNCPRTHQPRRPAGPSASASPTVVLPNLLTSFALSDYRRE